MTTALFQTELSRVRDWLNGGIVIGDVTATAVDRTHVRRPNVFGFPLGGQQGALQDHYERSNAKLGAAARPGVASATSTDLQGRFWIARQPERFSIFPEYLFESENFRIAQLAARFTLDVACTVDVGCTWEAVAQSYWDDVTSGDYPDDHAGSFTLRYEEIDDASETTVTGTSRLLPFGYFAGGSARYMRNNLFQSGAQLSLSAGTYDLWLNYNGDSVGAGLRQLILYNAELTIDAHR